MGNLQSIPKVNFEYIQNISSKSNTENIILINTLDLTYQYCLIPKTIKGHDEVNEVNNLLKRDKTRQIVVYGKNYHDEKIYKKYNQLKQLGFKNVKLYMGGMFEWLCLQEIYGIGLFPTEGVETDLLKYKT